MKRSIVLAAAAALTLVACGSKGGGAASPTTARRAPAAAAVTAVEPTTTTTTTEAPPPLPADYTVSLGVKEKQCFGTAGCDVTVEPTLSGPNPPSKVDITFEVDGDESGPITQTITLDQYGSYSYDEIMLQTSAGLVTPTARVESVEVNHSTE